jgi:glycosyltransferase involved in cell wall biosynthesis
MSKYLPDLGWQPVVYTPENPDFNLRDESLLDEIHKEVIVLKRPIWEPYAAARKLSKTKNDSGEVESKGFKSKFINFVRGNVFIPDPKMFWIKPSAKYLNNIIAEHDISHVVSTGPPHSMHLIALKLKQKNPSLKWIADFRDPWSEMDLLENLNMLNLSMRRHHDLESKVVNTADVVLSTSDHMHEMLQEFPLEKYKVVTNGYDDADFKNSTAASKTPSEQIHIFHAGLVNNYRIPIALLNSLNELASQGINFILHFVGNVSHHLSDEISKYEYLKDKVKIEPPQSHQKIIEYYGQASHLLLLINNSKVSRACIPGKLFEYLAAGKKIIAVGKPTDNAMKYVEQFGHFQCGYSDGIDNDKLRSFLESRVEVEVPDEFSRKKLAEKFVHEVLNLMD